MKRETRLVPNGKEAMGTNQNHMKSHLNTFSTVKLAKYWNRLPGNFVESPSGRYS